MLELPFPPKSLNPNKSKGKHWSIPYKAGKAYRTACYALAKSHKPMESFSFEILPPDNRKRDRDNIIAAFKYGQDGIAAAWGMDDNLFVITYLPMGDPVEGGKIILKPC